MLIVQKVQYLVHFLSMHHKVWEVTYFYQFLNQKDLRSSIRRSFIQSRASEVEGFFFNLAPP